MPFSLSSRESVWVTLACQAKLPVGERIRFKIRDLSAEEIGQYLERYVVAKTGEEANALILSLASEWANVSDAKGPVPMSEAALNRIGIRFRWQIVRDLPYAVQIDEDELGESLPLPPSDGPASAA